MGGEAKKATNRPTSRKLVRWNENLDELLLLTIQSVCNKEGVRIPWAEVANSMGNNVTEGAIVQHLAKVRARRVQKAKAVPPPLRRGGVGAAPTPKSPKAPATPVSPEPSAEDSGARREKPKPKPRTEPKIKVEKRAASDDEDYTSSDSDKEWSASPRSNSTKKRRHRKKRKSTPLPDIVSEYGVDDNDDDIVIVADESIGSDSEPDVVGVGAEFLEFSNVPREKYPSTLVSEDDDNDDQSDIDKSLIVKFKVEEKILRQLKHKGTGVFHDRNPEQRWTLPSGPNGEKWGFNRDYYGPVPQSSHNQQNPGLLQGEWPREVAMRQYDAPQAATWANETHEPDPRLVHPAKYLEEPDCEPQLKMHRKLLTMEESNPDARVLDKERPAYQSYVKTHRELPTYSDSSWNPAPTKPSDDYPTQFSTINWTGPSTTEAAPNAVGYQHHNVNIYNVAHPQIEDTIGTHRMLDVKTEDINGHVDRHGELPPGKSFDVDKMLEQKIIEEGAGLAWWRQD